MERVQLQAGYVLHHRLFRDTSVIADVITPDYGVVRLMARGARSPRSKVRPLLQVFRPLLLSWAGRGEMRTLAGIEEQGMPYALERLQLACGYYLNELLLRLLPYNDSNITLFARYSESLASLAALEPSTGGSEQQETEIVLRHFELELLDTLGLVPDFSHCVGSGGGQGSEQGSEPVPGCRYRYNPVNGEAIPEPAVPDIAGQVHDTPASTGSAGGARPGDPTAFIPVDGASLLALGKRELVNPECLLDAKRIMRSQLALHLGNKPLKSREMIGLFSKPAGNPGNKTGSNQSTSDGNATC